MTFEKRSASACTSSMPAASVESVSAKKANCNRNIERWLASSGSCSSADSDITSSIQKTALADNLTVHQPQLATAQKLRRQEMSVLPARPADLAARYPTVTLRSNHDSTGEWRYWPQWSGPSWTAQAEQSLPLRSPQRPTSPVLEQPLTDWPITSPSTQLWRTQIPRPRGVNPKEVFTTCSCSSSANAEKSQSELAVFTHVSPVPSSDYDSCWEPDVDICSNTTPASTFSQCSSGATWLGSHNASRDPPDIVADGYSPFEQAGPLTVEAPITHQSPLQPRIGFFRDPKKISNADIPKSVPLDCQFMVGYANPDSTLDISTGPIGQGFQTRHDAQGAPKPCSFEYFDQLQGGSSFIDRTDGQTMKPSDVWRQTADLHISELPSPRTQNSMGTLDRSQPCRAGNYEAVPTMFQGEPKQSNPSKVDYPNNTNLPDGASRGIDKEGRCTRKQRSSRTRNRIRDEFLVRSKLTGMSYRDIRIKGNFTEAESTLRGRFRTLTKRKEQRVRKPQWHEKDVSTFSPHPFTRRTCNLQSLTLDQATQASCRRGFGEHSRSKPTGTSICGWR